MARPKTPGVPALVDELSTTAVKAVSAAINEVSAAEMGAINSAGLYMDVGRIQALDFQRSVADVALAQTYIRLKKSNEFKDLLVRGPDGDLRRVADLDEFCLLFFRKSYRRMQELANNYETLGPDLYEQAQQIGFSSRDYQSLKALPADMQAQVKAAIAEGSKDAAVELMCELASRASAMKTKLDEAEKSMAAKDKVIAKKDEKLNKLAEAEEARLNGTRNERESIHIGLLRDLGVAADIALQQLVAEAVEVFRDPPTESTELQARQTLEFIGQRFADLCAEANIGIDLMGERIEPGWRREMNEGIAKHRRT
jgi:hypothetical protein